MLLTSVVEVSDAGDTSAEAVVEVVATLQIVETMRKRATMKMPRTEANAEVQEAVEVNTDGTDQDMSVVEVQDQIQASQLSAATPKREKMTNSTSIKTRSLAMMPQEAVDVVVHSVADSEAVAQANSADVADSEVDSVEDSAVVHVEEVTVVSVVVAVEHQEVVDSVAAAEVDVEVVVARALTSSRMETAEHKHLDFFSIKPLNRTH